MTTLLHPASTSDFCHDARPNEVLLVLENMAKLNESKRFLHSMAPRALGVSHYPLIIRHPMAIADIRWKLHHDMHSSIQSFAADLRQMIDNAFQSNERCLIDISQLQLTRARVCRATGDLSRAECALAASNCMIFG